MDRLLFTNVRYEFEKEAVEVQDFRKITDRFRGIYRICLKLIEKSQKMSTCNRTRSETQAF